MQLSFLIKQSENNYEMQLSLAQSVTALAADKCLTADTGVASSIPAWSYTVMEFNH